MEQISYEQALELFKAGFDVWVYTEAGLKRPVGIKYGDTEEDLEDREFYFEEL